MRKPTFLFVRILLFGNLFTSIFGLSDRLHATVTLEIQFENGTISGGSIAAIVADTVGNGFTSLTDPSVSGTPLSIGATIGMSDDTIIAVFNASSGDEWNSGTGFAETFASLDYSQLGISEGIPFIIYVFPELTTPDSLFILGDEFVVYRNSTTGGSGGDSPFEAPADPGYYALAALTPSNGGNFDPTNPSLDETYETGNTGTMSSGNPDDVGNSRDKAAPLSGGEIAGNLDQGDLDFFQFQVDEPTLFTTSSMGDAQIQAWIFDEFGNVIYSPEGGGSLSFAKELQPGIYYLAIQGTGSNEQGSYTLNSSQAPAVVPLTLNSGSATFSGQFYSDETNTYSFTLNGTLVATLYTTGSLDTRGVLRDVNDSILNDPSADDDAGDELNFQTVKTLPPGDYTVAVSANGGAGAYGFNIETAAVPVIPPTVVDNTVLKSKTSRKIKKLNAKFKKLKKKGSTSKAKKLKKKIKKLKKVLKML